MSEECGAMNGGVEDVEEVATSGIEVRDVFYGVRVEGRGSEAADEVYSTALITSIRLVIPPHLIPIESQIESEQNHISSGPQDRSHENLPLSLSQSLSPQSS